MQSETVIPEVVSPLGIFFVALTVLYILLWGLGGGVGETRCETGQVHVMLLIAYGWFLLLGDTVMLK